MSPITHPILGIMIGLLTGSFQQYLSQYIYSSKHLLKYYESPTNMRQAWTFFNAVRGLQSFTSNIRNRMQMAVAGSFLDMGLKLAVFRQFNSGWSSNFASVQMSFYRKVPTMLGAFIVASPFGVAFDMFQRAYQAERTFPKELQKGYKSFFDLMRRIPVEEGPYYLFKNTFPLWVKHILGPFTAFYTYDFLIDKLSVAWRMSDNPVLPFKLFSAGVASYLAIIFTYPFAHTIREMVDMWPKPNGVDIFDGSYRKAAQWLWFGPTWNIGFPGLYKIYFWHQFPMQQMEGQVREWLSK